MQDASLEIVSRRFAVQLFLEDRMKDLKRAGAVNEHASRAGDQRCSNRNGVAIARIVVVEREDRIEAAGKIEKFPNGDPRLARIGFPSRDGFSDALVEVQQSIVGRGERRQTPKSLCPAINLARLASRLFQERLAILQHQKRRPTRTP